MADRRRSDTHAIRACDGRLRNESLEDSANLPDPDSLAAENIEDLQSALEELQAISDDLAQTPGALLEGRSDDEATE